MSKELPPELRVTDASRRAVWVNKARFEIQAISADPALQAILVVRRATETSVLVLTHGMEERRAMVMAALFMLVEFEDRSGNNAKADRIRAMVPHIMGDTGLDGGAPNGGAP